MFAPSADVNISGGGELMAGVTTSTASDPDPVDGEYPRHGSRATSNPHELCASPCRT